jgi:hypothetical protein
MPREKNLEYYQNLAAMLIDQDSDRDSAYADYQDMYHLDFELPKALRDLPWVRNVISSAPHDAVSAAKRVLSSVKPQPKFQPLDSTQQSKERAAEIENLLMWQLYGVNARKGTTIVADIVESALLYMSVAAMVIDLDYHIKQMKGLGRDTSILERARKKGRFVVNVYSPSNVHVRKTSMGNEAVLLHVKRSAIDVIEEWGDPDGTLMDIADSNGDLTYYDVFDWDTRCVWVSGETPKQKSTGFMEKTPTPSPTMVELLPPTKHNLDFNPWVAALGDSALEDEAEHKYHPLLYAVRRSRSWETLNITQSLAISDEIAKASYPDLAEEGANMSATTEIDYTDASKIAKVPTGNTLKMLGRPGLDQGKMEIIDRIRSEMEQSTVSSVLQGGSIASNVAFASLNLSTQMAVGALKPSKELAENSIAEIFKLMLLWAKATGKPLEGWMSDARSDGYGEQLLVEPDTYSEETLYISVELTPDVPTDRQQRANAAGMMIQWGYPKEYALEDVGVTDPGKAMQTSAFEQMQETKVAIELQRQQAELQMQIQDMQFQQQLKQQQMQMEMEQQMAAMMQQQQAAQGQVNPQMMGPPPQAGPPAGDMAMMSQGPMPGGAAFDTGSGGLPGAMANPVNAAQPMGGTDKEGQPMLDLEGMLSGQGETLAG